MSEEQQNNTEVPTEKEVDPTPPYVSSDTDIAKARKWFQRAAELADGKSWDFAIKCYVDGLHFWPDAVEEGHQPLRAAAAARHLTGGKKPSFTEQMKYSMTGKDAKKAMLNAEWLLSHDPFNITYMEGLLRNAGRLRCEDTLLWIGPIYKNAIEKEKKLNPKRCALLRQVYEEAGDRYAQRGDGLKAVDCYERASEALRFQKMADPKDNALDNELRDLSTKLTILKGKYESAETFTDSMRDADQQRGLQDQERMVQAEESLKSLIKRAEEDLAQNPENTIKVRKLADLLCSRDDPEDEKRAIAMLVDKYKTYGDYSFKMKAEDIRIRQLKRVVRQAREAKDPQRLREAQIGLLKFEIKALRERVEAYPTDNKLKFELAKRLFTAGKYDDAIPLFQTARADAKVRTQCDLFLGQCFYQKGFHAQAIGTLNKAVQAYEIPDDEVAKDLRYWLGRTYESSGDPKQAMEAYGNILEMDYNFRDVRDRLETLSRSASEKPAS